MEKPRARGLTQVIANVGLAVATRLKTSTEKTAESLQQALDESELICRGTVQGSMEHLVVGRWRTPLAILLSNGIFFVTHLESSMTLAAAAGLCGLGWGWLCHRHKSLVGVSVSHALLGVWAFEVVGLSGAL